MVWRVRKAELGPHVCGHRELAGLRGVFGHGAHQRREQRVDGVFVALGCCARQHFDRGQLHVGVVILQMLNSAGDGDGAPQRRAPHECAQRLDAAHWTSFMTKRPRQHAHLYTRG